MVAISSQARRVVAEQFSGDTFTHALRHAEEGRVHLVKPPPWPVVARIEGEGGHVVTVDYNRGNRYLSGQCSCATATDCEHAAATALVVFSRERELQKQRAEAARDRAVADWLANLGRPATEPAPTPTSHAQTVAYVLSRRDGQVVLAVFRASVLRRGGLSRGTLLPSFADPTRPMPAWVSEDDLRRIALLRAVSRVGPNDRTIPADRLGADVFRDLADSGALFWNALDTEPLAYGDDDHARLCWQSDDDHNEHTLALDIDLELIAAREPHYVDPHSATIGPLHTGIDASVLQALIASPPVPTRMLATVQKNLEALIGSHARPKLPNVASTSHAQAPLPETLEPRLTLSIREDDDGHDIALRADAVYGDRSFELGVWDAQRPAPRDLIEEGRRRAELDSFLGNIPPRRDPSRAAADLLDDARYLAHEVVPRLRLAGWQCVVDRSFPVEAPATALRWHETLEPMPEKGGWFRLELGVVVAGRTVPLLPILLHAIRSGQLRVGEELENGTHPGVRLRLPDGTQYLCARRSSGGLVSTTPRASAKRAWRR